MSILCLTSINAYTQVRNLLDCVVFITCRDVDGKESQLGRKLSPDKCLRGTVAQKSELPNIRMPRVRKMEAPRQKEGA
jgi:hypothetical protein